MIIRSKFNTKSCQVSFESKHLTVGSIAVGTTLQFTAKLKNTGSYAAVFSTTCTTKSLWIGVGTGVRKGLGIGTGTGTEDLEMSITPQRVSVDKRNSLLSFVIVNRFPG